MPIKLLLIKNKYRVTIAYPLEKNLTKSVSSPNKYQNKTTSFSSQNKYYINFNCKIISRSFYDN